MNRAQRRARRHPDLCEHGHVKKTDSRGKPYCPHGCGFPDSQRPEPDDAKPPLREFLRQQTANANVVDYRGRGA